MRLGVLTTSYPRYAGDPAGSFVAELADWLAAQGDQVEVLAPDPARGDPSLTAVQVRPLRYARRPQLLYGAGAPDNLRRPAAWLQVPSFLAQLSLSCRRCSASWQAVLSHWLLPCGLVAAVAARGLPHLAIAHSSDVHLLSRLPGLGAGLLALLARRQTALVLTSQALRAPLFEVARSPGARRLVSRAEVLRMGVPDRLLGAPPEPGARQRCREALGLNAEASLALYLGRLVPVKGVDLLLEACAGLPGFTLLVVGDGPEREALERQARASGAAAIFLGEQIGAAKAGWLAAADWLVLPSRILPDGRTDSAPLVLLEAMAAGLPVLATRVGGNAELIRDGQNGVLVEAGQVTPLRRALARLLSDPLLRACLADAGRATAAAHSWDRLGPRFRQLLQAAR